MSRTVRGRRGAGVLNERIRVLVWVLHARWRTERAVRTVPLPVVRVPASPCGHREEHLPLVERVLAHTRTKCLVRGLVVQRYLLDRGQPVDLVLGTSPPGPGFQAHAWLDRDGEDDKGHAALYRLSAAR